MSDQKAPKPGRHLAAVALVVVGVLILIGLAVFVLVGQSATAGPQPIEDLAIGVAAMTPVVVVALLLIGYGRRLLRKE